MNLLDKSLENILSTITLKKVSVWLKDVFYFLIKPPTFYKRYFSRSHKNQVYQILFYALLNALIYFTFGAGQSYQASFRLLFLILLASLPFIIVNSISFGLLGKFNLWRISSYIIICILIFFFPILLLQNIFLQTENYTFAFLSNLCLAISIIYNLFIIHIASNKAIRKVILGFLLNVIVLNLMFLMLGLLTRDSYSKSHITDPIIGEYNTYAASIIALKGKPSNFIELYDLSTKTKIAFIGYSKEDSIQYYGPESIKYIRQNAMSNYNYLDSVLPEMHFKRNEEIYTDLKAHFSSLNSYFDSNPCDTCLVRETIFKDSVANSILLIRKEYLIDQNYIKHFENFENKRRSLYELDEYAYSPNRLLEVLFYPTDFIADVFNLKRDEQVTFFIR